MAELTLAASIRDQRGLIWEALLQRWGQIDPNLVKVLDLDHVVGAALPALGWQFDLLGDLWDVLPDDAARRTFIQNCYSLVSRRGTPYAVKTALGYLGYFDIVILENQGSLHYDGAANYDGFWYYGTGFFNWWEWGVEVGMSGRGYTTSNHAQLKRIAAQYSPERSRLVRVVLHLETLTTTGITPAFTGPSAITQIGISPDGVTWTRRTLLHIDQGPGSQADCQWRVFEVDGPITWSHIALFQADGTIFDQKTRTAAIANDTDMQSYGTWHLSW